MPGIQGGTPHAHPTPVFLAGPAVLVIPFDSLRVRLETYA